MRLVLASTFSPNMLGLSEGEERAVFIKRISLETARDIVKKATDRYSIVGHESTARLMSEMLGVNVPANRVQYLIKDYDTVLVVTLAFRPPEGKVYTYNELRQLYKEGKIAIYIVDAL
ncbi:MAG TPA: DUF1874 domain-containing protein [Euryarchaeota archaeon]|nr:DUF1874 domain-containing protein [Euryarchaeota archaeon]